MAAFLNGESLFAPYIDKPVDLEALTRVAYVDSDQRDVSRGAVRYVVQLNNDYELPNCPAAFGVTKELNESWWTRAITFCVCVEIGDGRLLDGSVYKYREGFGVVCFMPGGSEVGPTQKEYAVARRVVRYLMGVSEAFSNNH